MGKGFGRRQEPWETMDFLTLASYFVNMMSRKVDALNETLNGQGQNCKILKFKDKYYAAASVLTVLEENPLLLEQRIMLIYPAPSTHPLFNRFYAEVPNLDLLDKIPNMRIEDSGAWETTIAQSDNCLQSVAVDTAKLYSQVQSTRIFNAILKRLGTLQNDPEKYTAYYCKPLRVDTIQGGSLLEKISEKGAAVEDILKGMEDPDILRAVVKIISQQTASAEVAVEEADVTISSEPEIVQDSAPRKESPCHSNGHYRQLNLDFDYQPPTDITQDAALTHLRTVVATVAGTRQPDAQQVQTLQQALLAAIPQRKPARAMQQTCGMQLNEQGLLQLQNMPLAKVIGQNAYVEPVVIEAMARLLEAATANR